MRSLLFKLAIVLIHCCLLPGSFCLAEGARPNVILIVTDDQGYGDMSCHDNPWLETPNLDRLHDEGVSLDDYHVDPVCTPTRASLMSGQYCSRNGAWGVTIGRQLLNPDLPTMADIFAAGGYATGMFGKWHLGDAYPYAPRHRGFQDVVRHLAGGIDEISNPEGNNYFDDTLYRNGEPEKFEGYCTDIFFDETIRLVKENRENPFFIYLATNAMHGPFTVAEQYSDRFRELGHPEDRSKFYGMIENFDENLGRLFVALEENGVDENTLIIFMGDNGTAGGVSSKNDNGGYGGGMRGKKGSVYEGGHRVACFARWPGGLKPRTVEELTSVRDWLPTLIDLCGLEKPEGAKFDGTSIRPLLEEEAESWPDRTFFVERQDDILVKAPLKPGGGKRAQYPNYAVVTEKWRLVNGELYDIENDPAQANDIAKAHPEVVQQLYADYGAWFDDVASHKSEYTRFLVGDSAENPTLLTVRDWHPTEGPVIWKKEHLFDDEKFLNGFWAIDVVADGTYEFCLSRHQDDAPHPMKAIEATIRLVDDEGSEASAVGESKEIQPSDTDVTFTLDLKRGPAILQTALMDEGGHRVRGAYFVTVKRL